MTPEEPKRMSPDESKRLIDASGGNHAFALMLGLPINRATSSRVSQWKRRGIPPSVITANAERIRTMRMTGTRRGML